MQSITTLIMILHHSGENHSVYFYTINKPMITIILLQYNNPKLEIWELKGLPEIFLKQQP